MKVKVTVTIIVNLCCVFAAYTQEIIFGLNQRLEEFQSCEILVVNAHHDINLEPTQFPIVYCTSIDKYEPKHTTNSFSTRLPYDLARQTIFKHAEIICQLHLFIFPDRVESTSFEFSHFSFYILLLPDSAVQSKDSMTAFESYLNTVYLRVYVS